MREVSNRFREGLKTIHETVQAGLISSYRHSVVLCRGQMDHHTPTRPAVNKTLDLLLGSSAGAQAPLAYQGEQKIGILSRPQARSMVTTIRTSGLLERIISRAEA